MCRPPVCCDCRWVARLARCPASRSPANQTPERKRQMRNQGENWSTPGGLSTEYSDVAHCTGTGGSMVRCGRNGGESWKLGAAADFTITTRKSEGGGLELQQDVGEKVGEEWGRRGPEVESVMVPMLRSLIVRRNLKGLGKGVGRVCSAWDDCGCWERSAPLSIHTSEEVYGVQSQERNQRFSGGCMFYGGISREIARTGALRRFQSTRVY
eukprot:1195476-Prorocentrum_minimum.AAC.4